jgi:hypothetical protein
MSEGLPPGITLPPVAIDVAKRCNLDQAPVASIIGYGNMTYARLISHVPALTTILQVSSKRPHGSVHRPVSPRLYWRLQRGGLILRRSFVICVSMHASLTYFMQNLRDVAKSLESVEKLNKLKVKTISALHAIPSLPYRVLNDVIAAVDSDDVKEIAGQFITKATPSLP